MRREDVDLDFGVVVVRSAVRQLPWRVDKSWLTIKSWEQSRVSPHSVKILQFLRMHCALLSRQPTTRRKELFLIKLPSKHAINV